MAPGTTSDHGERDLPDSPAYLGVISARSRRDLGAHPFFMIARVSSFKTWCVTPLIYGMFTEA